jgi:hypothetical protein
MKEVGNKGLAENPLMVYISTVEMSNERAALGTRSADPAWGWGGVRHTRPAAGSWPRSLQVNRGLVFYESLRLFLI